MDSNALVHLNQRREPLTAEDRELLRSRAWVWTGMGAIAAVILLPTGLSFFGQFLSDLRRVQAFSLILWGKGLLSTIAIGATVVLGYYVRRAWQETRQTHKTVYRGTVTSKYRSGPASNQNVYTAKLDGIEFEFEEGEWKKFEMGDMADFHCIRPGDAFRAERVTKVTPKAKPVKRQQNNTRLIAPALPKLRWSQVLLIALVAAGILAFSAFQLVFAWWASYPPLSLFTRGETLEAIVASSYIEKFNRTSKPRGTYYRARVFVKIPATTTAPSAASEEATGGAQVVELRALADGEADFQNESEARPFITPYPVGMRLSVYTLDSKSGPFYAHRFLWSFGRSFVTSLAMDVGLIVLLFYLWRRQSRTKEQKEYT